MTSRDDLEAAIWQHAPVIGVASSHLRKRHAVDAILAAADRYAGAITAAAAFDEPEVTAARRQLLEDAIYRRVHWLGGGAALACGQVNANVVTTTVPGRVTCGACKQTPAWKDTK